MYTDFYKLKQKPFRISSDPAFIWLGEKHREGLATLRYGVLDNKGFMLLTGDVGTGKTTLINTLIEGLGDDVYYASVPDPRLNLEDFLNYIGQAFHIDHQFKSKGSFLLEFGWFLEAAYKQNKKVLLIIDEAQLLTQTMLEEIRLLSNINRDGNHLLNIFFIGQNEFNEVLRRPENRAVAQRLALNYQIKPLSLIETELYIRHRLKVAGLDTMLFNPSAVRAIDAFAEGIPRRINIICDHCLLTGYIGEKAVIDAAIVNECAKEIEIPRYIKPQQEDEQLAPPEVPAPVPSISRPEQPVRSGLSNFFVMPVMTVAMFFAVLGLLIFMAPEKFASLYLYAGKYMENQVKTARQVQSAQILEPEGATAIPLQTANKQSSGEVGTGPDDTPSAGQRPLGKTEDESIQTPPASTEGTPAPVNSKVLVSSLQHEDVLSTSVQPVDTVQESNESENTRPDSPSDEDVPAATPDPESPDQTALVMLDQDESPPLVPSLPDKKIMIKFTTNSNDFNSDDINQLAALARSVRRNENAVLKISGYTDMIGSVQYNESLSLFRANMVKSYLLGQGVLPRQLDVKGFGSVNPIADNNTPNGRRLNRRVEIEVVKQ